MKINLNNPIIKSTGETILRFIFLLLIREINDLATRW